MSDVSTSSGASGQGRWLILGVIGIAQLMVVLDTTYMIKAFTGEMADLQLANESTHWNP